jgi:hypothetical protein
MKKLAIFAAALMLSTISHADHWIADQNGCKTYAGNVPAGITATWTGGCKNGYVNGRGILRAYHDGSPFQTYSGEMKEGHKHGKGVLVPATSLHDRYEGEFVNDKFQGLGVMRAEYGSRFFYGKYQSQVTPGYGYSLIEGEWADDDFKMKHSMARTTASQILWARPAIFERDTTPQGSVPLFSDVVPYTDMDSVCDKPDDVSQKGRWLLDNNQGVAIDLNNGLMFKRHPLGTEWVKGKSAFTGLPTMYQQAPPSAGEYLKLSGWRVTDLDEARDMHTKCLKNKKRYSRFNDAIFPVQAQNAKLYVVTPMMGPYKTTCRLMITRDGPFNLDWSKFMDHDEMLSLSRSGSYSGCVSGGPEKGIAYPVRKLTTYEQVNYERIFEEKVGTTPSQKAYVSYLYGEKIDGSFNATGSGDGLMEYRYKNFYYGKFSRYVPHGKGVYLDRDGNRYEGSAVNGSVQNMEKKECKLQTDVFHTLISSVKPFYWDPMNANMTQHTHWLGACIDGVADGAGIVVTWVSVPEFKKEGLTAEAFFYSFMSMKKGVPTGEYVVSGGIYSNAEASRPAELEVGKISNGKIERNYAQENRDRAIEGVNRLMGAAIGYVGKMIAEGARAQQAACREGTCNFVSVTFDVTSGFSTEGLDRVFSMQPEDEATGKVEPSASKQGAAIHKTIKPSVAGYYRWNASWDKGSKACNGRFYVTGSKPNLGINVYTDCKDAGTREF